MRVLSVVGARPNFMKVAPLIRAIALHNEGPEGRAAPMEHLLVHTGQHYDDRMSALFFDALDIPRPDVDLGVGSGSHAQQVGQTMIALEPVFREARPDWVVVVGDVNATCAAAITAKKEHLKLAHIEAGLRSFDLEMPEEINRMVTDRLADLLLTPDPLAGENLRHEGVREECIAFVGNIMIDTLEANRAKAGDLALDAILGENRLAGDPGSPGWADRPTGAPPSLPEEPYAVVTLHRPSNVDDPKVLRDLCGFFLGEVAARMPLIWPIHPRAHAKLAELGLLKELRRSKNVFLLQPVGYLEMLRLNLGARIALTDSGGLQEECCVLGTPCLTLRFNTERPITLEEHGGTCVLVGNGISAIREAFLRKVLSPRTPFRPPLWDGQAAERVVAALASRA
jgi:UDP-N-acetylglucosamine 2-epimerase (non-hydrolysing)